LTLPFATDSWEYFNASVLVDFMDQQEKQIILQMNIFCAYMQVLL